MTCCNTACNPANNNSGMVTPSLWGLSASLWGSGGRGGGWKNAISVMPVYLWLPNTSKTLQAQQEKGKKDETCNYPTNSSNCLLRMLTSQQAWFQAWKFECVWTFLGTPSNNKCLPGCQNHSLGLIASHAQGADKLLTNTACLHQSVVVRTSHPCWSLHMPLWVFRTTHHHWVPERT